MQSAKHVCVLTGAGISAASGIKTFRDAGGLWENHSRWSKWLTPGRMIKDDPAPWSGGFTMRGEKRRTLRPRMHAHLALARGWNWGCAGRAQNASFTILTQNVDGLHQQAGSQNVIELHGSVWQVRCMDCCEEPSEDYPLELPIPARCDDCGALLRPERCVVCLARCLIPRFLEASESRLCETVILFIVVGTSAVRSARGFISASGRTARRADHRSQHRTNAPFPFSQTPHVLRGPAENPSATNSL